ncbi:MAG: acyl-CoA dehydrogenase [Deltaproteobacteria bacterium]|nr:MAG: acyl-CoA dehydrogenase [Deltaproteobacteria bacterium]
MLLLTEDQEMLLQSAREVLDGESPISHYRKLRDDGQGSNEALWQSLTELGWPAMVFPEEQGGLGWGLPEACIVLECMGRNLALTPMLSVLLAGQLDPEARAAEGRVVALAWQETRDFAPEQVRAAVADGRLTGRKLAVADAAQAEAFVVSAVAGGEVRLFLVEASHARLEALDRIDHRDAAHVAFEGAPCTPLDAGLAELEGALFAGAVGLSAELLGLSRQALAMTLAYSRERVQFDKPIGSFQALQHRMVDMYIAVESLHSAVLAASREPSAELVALCKATANESAMAVCREAIQIHGGIGVTDEHDVGFLLKRAMVASQSLGTTRYWRDRWARERGY